MESNVSKIDFDELKKAREALNAEQGISTPTINTQNEKKVESDDNKADSIPLSTNSESQKETDISNEYNGDISSVSQEQEIPVDENDKDFSVYDNFSPFEINKEDDVPFVEIYENETSNQEIENQIDNEENVDSDENEENDEEDEDFIQELLGIYGENLGDDFLGDDEENEELVDEEENYEEPVEEDDDEETVNDSLDDLYNSLIDEPLESSNDEQDFDNIETDDSNETNDFNDEKSDEEKVESESSSKSEDFDLENQDNATKITDEIPENSAKKETTSEINNNENKSINKKPENQAQNSNEVKKFILPNIERVEEKKVNNEIVEPKKRIQPVDKIDSNSTSANKDSSNKEILDKNLNENIEDENSELDEVKKENCLKKIDDANFIDIIRSKPFMSSDNLTCIYGTDEQNEVFCQNFKDFYNAVIFCEKDESIFNLFSSIIMSLLLKNSSFDVKFAIFDAKSGGPLTIYNNLSFLMFDKVIEANTEIGSCLSDLCTEIDSRYKSLAKAGVKNIEKFNDEMKKVKISPLPYLLVFFNNYTRATHLDVSNEIDTRLSYILRYGRLVGVYVNLVAFDENITDKINFNLQTRISFKTDLRESSMSQLGEGGAEKIGYDDEFLIKTLYSDKLFHLKAPKISQKEIELLIKNIEK